jgi:hypothetical protein
MQVFQFHMAQGGNTDADTSCRFENGGTGGNFQLFSVDR